MQKNITIKIITVVFLVLIISFQSLAQFFDLPTTVLDKANLSITYAMAWKQDTNNLEYTRREEMILLVGKKISMFQSKNFYQFCSIGRKAEQEGRLDGFLNGPEIGNFKTRYTYAIYKNYPAGSYTYTDKMMPGFFQYDESFDVFNWKLSNQVDTIGGYVAHCAFADYGGRHWVAWYTTDIPLNDGPYKFRGLPGLIIRLYDDQKHYSFDMVKIERYDESKPIEFPDMGWVHTTRNNFLKAEENFRLDIINRAKSAGASSETQQAAARNMMKKNNPIEF